jgi:hypothetical protein
MARACRQPRHHLLEIPMTRSRFSLVLAAACALACAAFFAVDRLRSEALERVVSAVRRARDWLVDFVVAPIRRVLAKFSPWVMSLPAVKLLAAKLYVMRQVRRERPSIEPQWRMCPSG